MHMIIRNIVYADSKSEALSVARQNFENLCESENTFDYFDTFEGGSSYWGDKYPEVALSESRKGRKMIVGGWKATLKDMRRNLKSIIKLTQGKKVTEIMRDIRQNWLQYHFKSVGDYQGESVWLYDHDGEGIKDRKHLDKTLNKWDDNKDYKGMKVYVVPADVHY
jgi:hypothetical protein